MKQDVELISYNVIGAAIEVHKNLGAGLLERVYQDCLVYELRAIGLKVEAEKFLPVVYKDLKFSAAYRIDILINDTLIIELKAVDKLLSVYKAQLL